MQEQTFTTFTTEAAASYAVNRSDSYPTTLYDAILSYALVPTTSSFASTSQSLVVDVGTGPGKVLYDFLPFFDAGVGTDSSEGMIHAAKADERYSQAVAKGKEVRFEVCRAEDIAELVDLQEKADLIVVAMAVGFNMVGYRNVILTIYRRIGLTWTLFTLRQPSCSSQVVHWQCSRAHRDMLVSNAR